MYAHQDIEMLLLVGIAMLKDINIPISDSICPKVEFPKATSFYGQCCPKGSLKNRSGYDFLIRISEYHLNSSFRAIMNTIFHELLHTCTDCNNHGKEWKAYAHKVHSIYGYDVKRANGDKEGCNLRAASGRVRMPSKRIALRCNSCGTTYVRSRESKATLHPELYCCWCGGKIERLR